MKKKVMAAAIFAAAVFCFIFTVGCGKNTLPQGHSTLTLRDMFVAVGDSAQIEAEFSSGEPIPIEYLFDGNAISIEDGMVHALAAGETVQVFATTEYHNTEFTVTTTEAREESKEVFSISDISAWVGWQPSDFVPVFDASANISGEIQYEYDETRISVDAEACTVTALQDGKTVVKATCGGYAASFSVNCYAAPDMTGARYDTTDYNEYRAGLSSQWNNEAEDGKTTVFIGDSFFDTRWFWKDFYQTYAGKDALCLGISATTSYDWEKFLLKDNMNTPLFMYADTVFSDTPMARAISFCL